MIYGFIVAVFVVLALLQSTHALVDLPERARGGRAALVLKQRTVGGAGVGATESAPLYWTSKQDHFSTSNNATFQQKYFVDASLWDSASGGPVFFEIGGEGTLSGAPGKWSYIYTLAQQYKAIVVALEHRFYGDSFPNGNSNSDNLELLTVENALADLAQFTKWFTAQYKTGTASWFVFGGSYPGALSSWYRQSYPDLSAGSLSSSGVVNCIVDYYQFDQSVSAAVGNSCADQVKRINAAFEKKSETPEGFSEALGMFHCEKDMWKEDLFYMMADSWSMAVQYGGKTQLCGAIDNDTINSNSSDDDLMNAFSTFSNNFWGGSFCAGGFYNTNQLSDPARWEPNSRSWRWQTCKEVSYFNTAPAQGSLRSKIVDLDYHLRQCKSMFGNHAMFPTSAAINKKFGADEPFAHNVFYSDFSDDPWQRASVNYPVSSDQPYFLTVCEDCGHCKDFSAPDPNEPTQVTRGRQEFEKYLAKWLQEAESKKKEK